LISGRTTISFSPVLPPDTITTSCFATSMSASALSTPAWANFEASVGEPVALGLRVRRHLNLDRQTAFGEQAFLLCNIKRQVLRTWEDIDAQFGFLRGDRRKEAATQSAITAADTTDNLVQFICCGFCLGCDRCVDPNRRDASGKDRHS
jgi:hypothetical protein